MNKTVDISHFRRNLMRAMYLFISAGLFITVWPRILFPTNELANSYTVIDAMLGSMAVISLLGIRYPIKLLPILLFELLWKLMWVVNFAGRAWLNDSLDHYATETLFACALGIILTPIVIPWNYVIHHYIQSPGDPWR